jgi:hypothetical protein
MPGALPGIEKFDRDIAPLTIICGADTYQVRYSKIAQGQLVAALAARGGPPKTAVIDKVDIRLRCHSQGIAGTTSRCYADTALEVSLSDRAGGGNNRKLDSSGRNSEAVAFGCGAGRQAIEYSLEQAVGRMSYSISSGQ